MHCRFGVHFADLIARSLLQFVDRPILCMRSSEVFPKMAVDLSKQ